MYSTLKGRVLVKSDTMNNFSRTDNCEFRKKARYCESEKDYFQISSIYIKGNTMILFKSKSMRLSVSIASVLLLMSFVFSNKVSITAHDISAQKEIVPTKPEPLFTDAEHDFVQVGEASWYGAEFHNRPTASGECLT
jgi:rare lipoprotein A (peptidoglycan hydrolase)